VILLKPQDVVVLLKLGLGQEGPRTLAALSRELGISASEIHAAIRRAGAAALLDPEQRKPRVRNLLEFLEHGIRYAFVSRRGEITRGIPTAHSAPPLNQVLVQGPLARMFSGRAGEEASGYGDASNNPYDLDIVVWPDPDGEVRGQSFEPLYPSAVGAARLDPKLYECLALVDALRMGRAREKKIALDFLAERLRSR
jgi:hypothetical protein